MATPGIFSKVFLKNDKLHNPIKKNSYIDANNNQKTRKFISDRRFSKLKLTQICIEDEDESYTKN